MSKLRYDVKGRASNVFAEALSERGIGADVDTFTALAVTLETLIHEGYLALLPETKECPMCRGKKMTEGTIGYFACLTCGGRGRVTK